MALRGSSELPPRASPWSVVTAGAVGADRFNPAGGAIESPRVVTVDDHRVRTAGRHRRDRTRRAHRARRAPAGTEPAEESVGCIGDQRGGRTTPSAGHRRASADTRTTNSLPLSSRLPPAGYPRQPRHPRYRLVSCGLPQCVRGSRTGHLITHPPMGRRVTRSGRCVPSRRQRVEEHGDEEYVPRCPGSHHTQGTTGRHRRPPNLKEPPRGLHRTHPEMACRL
jgi:hypothetical protein